MSPWRFPLLAALFVGLLHLYDQDYGSALKSIIEGHYSIKSNGLL